MSSNDTIITKTPDSTSECNIEKLKSLAKIIIPCILLAAAFALFVCSFFVGATIIATSSSGVVSFTQGPFYFFGDAFTELDTLLIGSVSNNTPVGQIAATEFGLYIPVIIIAIFVLANILVSLATLTICAIKVGLGLKNKTEIDIKKYVIFAFALFVATASLVYNALNVSSIAEMSFKMSGGSIAGIIIGAIAFLSIIIIENIIKCKDNTDKKSIIKFALSLLTIILLLVTIFFLNTNFIKIRNTSSDTVSVIPATVFWFTSLIVTAGNLPTTPNGLLVASSLFGYLTYLAAIVLICGAIYFLLTALMDEKPVKLLGFIFAAAGVGCILLNFIFAILACVGYAQIANSSSVTYSYTVILPFVFSLISLAGLIVNKFILSRNSDSNPPQSTVQNEVETIDIEETDEPASEETDSLNVE